MDALATVFADTGRAGVYQVALDAGEYARAAQAAGLKCFRIDLGRVRAKSDFLDRLSEAMHFPDWFGRNWDALADCLEDLSWVEGAGYVVVMEQSRGFCESRGHEFAEAMELMAEVAQYWREQGRPFWTLVAGTGSWDSGFPLLSVA